jgi:T5SS/PEP-CTERM-associated repeat protein
LFVDGGSLVGEFLRVEDGGDVVFGPSYDNDGLPAGLPTITLTGPQALVVDSSRVDGFHNAELEIDAGHLVSHDVEVGFSDSGRVDQVWAWSSDTLWDIDNLYLAGDDTGRGGGDAEFNVVNGAVVNVANQLSFGGSNGGTATVNVSDGGHLNVGSELRIGTQAGTDASLILSGAGSVVDNHGYGTIVGGDGIGRLELGTGGRLITDSLEIRDNATLGGTGGIEGDLTVFGTLSPGNSPGVTSVTGDLVLDSLATLLIEIGGFDVGTEFDLVDVTGDATLGGLLSIVFIDNFVPLSGGSFEFLRFGGGLFGQFDDFQVTGLTTGQTASLVFGANGISLVVPSAAPAPETLALMVFGLLMLGSMVRSRARGLLG